MPCSSTAHNEGDDSGFNSIVSTPETTTTTTAVTSTAPTGSITYSNSRLESQVTAAAMWPHNQGWGQLFQI